MKSKTYIGDAGLERWGLTAGEGNRLLVGAWDTVSLAEQHGTPLHVVNEDRLLRTAGRFKAAADSMYPGEVSIHYAFKCNAVPGIVEMIKSAGLHAEVMTEFELDLARTLGYSHEQIVVNGPCKTDSFLATCLQGDVSLIIIDSVMELHSLARIARDLGSEARILLRVNPDYVPRGMNRGTATGSRRSSPFGLDMKGGEVHDALAFIRRTPAISFKGFHFHIGTGIQDPRDYRRALACLSSLSATARGFGLAVEAVDVGGGIGVETTREFTTKEMLGYQALGWLPEHPIGRKNLAIEEFIRGISDAVVHSFSHTALPRLIYEPGRCITSANQFLLLTVHRIKERDGSRKWLITDGGLSTVTMPTFYEYHEVLLCNDLLRPRSERVTIVGPACFAGDIVYRNKRMPVVNPGEVIAIMDSGAYFTSFESSFGFPRPAIISVNGSACRKIRARETFEQMRDRDEYTHHNHNIPVTK